MDLLTYALLKNHSDSNEKTIDAEIPKMGENGNWFIGGIDTGIPVNNVEVDGRLVVDSKGQKISVEKDGKTVIVGNYTDSISSTDIKNLFKE